MFLRFAVAFLYLLRRTFLRILAFVAFFLTHFFTPFLVFQETRSTPQDSHGLRSNGRDSPPFSLSLIRHFQAPSDAVILLVGRRSTGIPKHWRKAGLPSIWRESPAWHYSIKPWKSWQFVPFLITSAYKHISIYLYYNSTTRFCQDKTFLTQSLNPFASSSQFCISDFLLSLASSFPHCSKDTNCRTIKDVQRRFP